AQDDTALRERGRPGPGLAGVAKREDSYGPKSGPKAGSRASSPGEQAAACDYIRTRELGSTRELGYKTREMACARSVVGDNSARRWRMYWAPRRSWVRA